MCGKQQDLSHDAVRAALSGRARPRAGMACLALAGSLLIGILGAMFSLREYP